MTRIALNKLNANQVSEKWVGFLKECSSFGDTVIYTEMKQSGGTWDAVKDRMVGAVETPVSQTFVKAALVAATRFDETNDAKSGMGEAFVMGHRLGDVVTGETYIARFKVEVPLTASGIYTINGMTYVFQRLVDSMRFGSRVMWNLALLVRS